MRRLMSAFYNVENLNSIYFEAEGYGNVGISSKTAVRQVKSWKFLLKLNSRYSAHIMSKNQASRFEMLFHLYFIYLPDVIRCLGHQSDSTRFDLT